MKNRSTPVRAVVLGLVLALGACASSAGSSPGRDPDLISTEELREHPQFTVLEMIRQFRPNWLSDRGGSHNLFGAEDIVSPQGIRLYVDGVVRQDGLQELELLSTSQVRELRRLGAVEATQRFGVGHSAGAILVTTARRLGR